MKCPKCNFNNPDNIQFCGDCGTKLLSPAAAPTESSESPRQELTTGSTFANRYKIVEELGQGGMGKVYKAIDNQLNEEVAIKLIKPEISSDKKTIKRFSNELKLSRKIGHRNVGRMYELMQDQGTYFITMEYVSGQDLKGLIRQSKQLTTGTTVSIAKQVCEGLIEAHRLGVMHRDLKPNNIMIDKGGNAKIMDFGIARSLSGKSLTKAGAMIGTPEYMSPEQAEGEEVDSRSDIYSLGVILFEMVTGRLPFEGETALSVAMKHKGETPKDPKEYNPQISDDLNGLILKCLEKDKESRYQEAEELLSELNNIEQGIPTTDRVVPRRKTTTSKEITVTLNLRKVLVPLLLVVGIVVVGVVVWQFVSPKGSPEIPSIAILPFEDFSQNEDQEHWCGTFTLEIISRLDNIESIEVEGRSSSFSLKEKGLGGQEIGQKLEVDYVVEGTLEKSENMFHIFVQLIKTVDGLSLGTLEYDYDEKDIIALHDKIASDIVERLNINLSAVEKSKIAKHITESAEALRYYSKGREYWNERTKEGFETAIDYFNWAIKEDENFALAYAGKADCYNLLGFYYLEPKEVFLRAKEAAQKALKFDNNLAEAHTSLAYVLFLYEWDWEGAEREFKEAISINPDYATAHHWYADFLTSMGKFDEAIAERKRAQELEPFSLIINNEFGFTFCFAGQYDQAIEAYRKVLKMEEGFWLAHTGIALVYLKKGMYKEALAENQIAMELYGGENFSLVGIIYALMGEREKAQEVFEYFMDRSKQEYVNPLTFANLCFALGKNDEGFKWFLKAYEEHDSGMPYIGVDPLYDSVCTDERFIKMLKKMNLDK